MNRKQTPRSVMYRKYFTRGRQGGGGPSTLTLPQTLTLTNLTVTGSLNSTGTSSVQALSSSSIVNSGALTTNNITATTTVNAPTGNFTTDVITDILVSQEIQNAGIAYTENTISSVKSVNANFTYTWTHGPIIAVTKVSTSNSYTITMPPGLNGAVLYILKTSLALSTLLQYTVSISFTGTNVFFDLDNQPKASPFVLLSGTQNRATIVCVGTRYYIVARV